MGGGGEVALILEPRRLVQSKKFFISRCPKDEPTGKNLVCKKALHIYQKNWKNLLGGGGIPPPLAIGGLKIELFLLQWIWLYFLLKIY